jgi:lipopolysaccharide/colanic/teichoic acid biosynthesis glycosyltransferase
MNVNNLNQEHASTREEYKKAKQEAQQKGMEKKKVQEGKTDAAPKQSSRIRIRIIPIWLRLVLLVVLIVVCVVTGAVVGYGMLGGGDVVDVFKGSTWTHIMDLVDKK